MSASAMELVWYGDCWQPCMHARCLIVVLALVGCATLPQPPPVLGPRGAAFSGALVEGVPYVPTRAVLSGPDTEPVTVEQRFDAYGDMPLVALVDPRFSATYSVNDRLHGTVHLGWWMSGLEVSVLPRGDQVATPVVVAVGAQVDGPARLLGSSATFWDARAQISVHPVVRSVQLILGAGFSIGRQKHDLALDGRFARPGDAGFAVPAVLRTSRREDRLESAIGFSLLRGQFRFAVAAQPFYVISHGDVSTLSCDWCFDRLHVDSLDASWGAVFTLTILGSTKRRDTIASVPARASW